MDWHFFECVNCGWFTKGTFNWNNEGKNPPLPDTDCPKCGFHDSVRDYEAICVPLDESLWNATYEDQNSGPYRT